MQTLVNTSGEGEVTLEVGLHKFRHDKKIEIKAEPEPGWKFADWQGDISELEQEKITITIDEDMEIRALFTKRTYTLDLKVENQERGNIELIPGEHTYKYNEEVTLKAKLKDGWQFSEWRGVVKKEFKDDREEAEFWNDILYNNKIAIKIT